LPLDVIKLDKSLVWSAMRHDERNDFMRCLVHGLHAIHISVIAEGVETEAHKNNIISFGCSAIQGFYFCKPMPQEQMIVFLRDKKNDRAQSDNESIRLLAENEASWTA
ncbi:MAG: EAL domain-containing protein, partial [Clostridia bacterium]